MPSGVYIRTKVHKDILSKNTPFKHGHSVNKGRMNNKANAWKGKNAGYRAIHLWFQRKYGKPTTCEECAKENLFGHNIHWANISRKYDRDRKDWIRLCVRCHKLFDIKMKQC